MSASSVIPLAPARIAITSSRRRQHAARIERSESSSRLPALLTPAEVASLLRTSRCAIYAMIERSQLPGVVRIGRRVLLRETDLLEWLRQKSTPFANEVSE